MNQITLNYHGSVDILLNIRGKIIKISNHNEGTPYLTQVFAKFMASYHDTNEKVKNIDTPQLIDLEFRHNEGTAEEPDWTEWQTFLNTKINISSKTYDYTGTKDTSNEQWAAHLTGTLSSYTMKEVVGTEYETNYEFRFVLKTGYDSNYSNGYHDLAYLTAPISDLERITAGTQATIIWNMYLENATVN